MLAKLPLRTRLVLVASVPLFVLVGVGAGGILSQLATLRSREIYGDLGTPLAALRRAARDLGAEAVASTWFGGTGGDAAARRHLTKSRTATDRSLEALRESGAVVDGVGDEFAIVAFDRLRGKLDALPGIRRRVGTTSGDPVGRANELTSLADDALDAAAVVGHAVDDQGLAQSISGIVDLERHQLATARETVLFLGFRLTGETAHFGEWVVAIDDQDTLSARFLAEASPPEATAFRFALAGEPPDDGVHVARSAGDVPIEFPTTEIEPIDYVDWFAEQQAWFASGIGAVQDVVDDTAVLAVGDARSSVLIYGIGACSIILVVLVLAWVVVRSVNRPLRTLTNAAREMSERRLPRLVDSLRAGGDLDPAATQLEPIDVHAHDELGELATAFNTIQQVTVRVAEEQAELLRKGIGDLYVDLARRNQSLLDRQITLLDELEQDAEDSDHLSALFRLDHLATRMRRNAENLLVLAGAEPPRQWREAVPIIDVVRGAAAEIVDFSRVAFYGFDETSAVAGNAVADATHLLAELLENATSFSAPGTPVVVAGVPAERRFIVSVTDEGLGMDDERLIAANALLARPPAPGLALSRQLGLLVVGHLAARHGVAVQLRHAATRGVTAIVVLPAAVLTRVEERSKPARRDVVTGVVAAEPVSPVPATRPAEPAAPEPDASRQVFVERDGASPSLTRRVPAPSGSSSEDPTSHPGLVARVPGKNLTHQPVTPGSSAGSSRPRPEHVHDLLSRHLRGIRDRAATPHDDPAKRAVPTRPAKGPDVEADE